MPTLMHYESSILSTLTNRVLTSAIVIIDTEEAMGRRLDASLEARCGIPSTTTNFPSGGPV